MRAARKLNCRDPKDGLNYFSQLAKVPSGNEVRNHDTTCPGMVLGHTLRQIIEPGVRLMTTRILAEGTLPLLCLLASQPSFPLQSLLG